MIPKCLGLVGILAAFLNVSYSVEPGRECWYGKKCGPNSTEIGEAHGSVGSAAGCYQQCRDYNAKLEPWDTHTCNHFHYNYNPLVGESCKLLADCKDPYSFGNPFTQSGPSDCTYQRACHQLTYGEAEQEANVAIWDCRWVSAYSENIPHMQECFSVPPVNAEVPYAWMECVNGTWGPMRWKEY